MSSVLSTSFFRLSRIDYYMQVFWASAEVKGVKEHSVHRCAVSVQIEWIWVGRSSLYTSWCRIDSKTGLSHILFSITLVGQGHGKISHLARVHHAMIFKFHVAYSRCCRSIHLIKYTVQLDQCIFSQKVIQVISSTNSVTAASEQTSALTTNITISPCVYHYFSTFVDYCDVSSVISPWHE